MPDKLILRGSIVAALLLLCLAMGVIGGMNFAPDVAAIRWLESVRASDPGLTMSAITITHAGSVWGTLGAGIGASGWLALRGEWRRGLILALAVAVERLTVDGLKLLLNRSRPSFDLHPVTTHSSSFPSGHSGNSMAVLLAIALIAVPRAHRVPAVIVAVCGAVLIGITRPYLGVHWPTDVIGGWSLGAAIAIVAASIADAGRSEPTQ